MFEWIKISELKPHPKNPNKHDSSQIERLIKIIKAYGWRHPIIISKQSGYIIVGHGRLEAAKKMGLKEVPVHYQDYKDESEEYGFMVADNSIASWADLDLASINLEVPNLGPDFDIDLLGIKDFEIEPADKYGDQDADATPEARSTTIKMGDLFSLGSHRLLCGDSTDRSSVEILMNGEKADMVYTDPPYGIKRDKGFEGFGGFGTPIKRRQYKDDWDSNRPLKEAFDLILSLSDQVIIWGGNFFADLLPQGKHWLVWDKVNTMPTFGDCELAYTNIKRTSVKQYTVQYNGLIGKEKERFHPTQKPVKLHEEIFKDYDPKLVVDLYGGSGSTLIACEKTNRKCFMMEIDPQYCQVIIDRFEKFTGQKAVKLDSEQEVNNGIQKGSVGESGGKAKNTRRRQRA